MEHITDTRPDTIKNMDLESKGDREDEQRENNHLFNWFTGTGNYTEHFNAR